MAASWQSAAAQSVALPAGALFGNVHLVWEGRQLNFYATFEQDGHDVPLWLEWHGKTSGRQEIDYIEQFYRGMPIAVTLVSLEKKTPGQTTLYMGRPAPNTPRLVSDGSMTGRLAVTDAAGHTDNYDFSLAPSAGEAAPRLSASK
jgi:hypothetical protein